MSAEVFDNQQQRSGKQCLPSTAATTGCCHTDSVRRGDLVRRCFLCESLMAVPLDGTAGFGSVGEGSALPRAARGRPYQDTRGRLCLPAPEPAPRSRHSRKRSASGGCAPKFGSSIPRSLRTVGATAVIGRWCRFNPLLILGPQAINEASMTLREGR